MDFYPSEFSPEARDRIEREKILAYRKLLPNSAYDFKEQNLAIPCIMRIFLAFAKEVCALRKQRGWTIERVERESNEFRRKLTITVVFDKFPDLDQHWISNWNGSINSDVERRFRESVEWKEYEELLLTTPASAPEERKSTNDQLHEKQIPTSQLADQNLRDAILKKKARIVEIECTLDRPQEEASRLRLGEDREHLVVEVEELEAELREALVDRAIASRKRRESSGMPEGARHTNLRVLDAQKSRALLGIELSDLENLRREVWMKFFDEASLPHVVQVELAPVLSSPKMPDSDVDLAVTFALTKEYVKAISRASAQLADLLVTATVSRISRAHFREAIWRECLDFAYQLGRWDAFASWTHRVVHIGWQAVTADGATDREQLEKALKPRREFFEKRIVMYSQEWLSAIDRAIELRRTVSASLTANASGNVEKQAPSEQQANNTREAFIKPILEKKGLSIRQWAINAKVDFHTADDYLKGKTKPYPDTLKKLADALGVEIGKLPL